MEKEKNAGMMELADMRVLETRAERRVGSTPTIRTKYYGDVAERFMHCSHKAG